MTSYPFQLVRHEAEQPPETQLLTQRPFSRRDRSFAADARRFVPGDELETAINTLRDRKGKMPKDQYYRELEGLLLQMARVYEESEANK